MVSMDARYSSIENREIRSYHIRFRLTDRPQLTGHIRAADSDFFSTSFFHSPQNSVLIFDYISLPPVPIANTHLNELTH